MSLVKVTNPETNVAVLEFSVAKDVFEDAVTKVYEKKKRDITLPGFRKGKAPRYLIEKMYGKGYFYEDAINAVLPTAYDEALKESGLSTVSNPEFDIVSLDDNGLVLSAKVYTKPEISINGYKGLTVAAHPVEVTEDEVNAEIDRLRERNARTVDVTDRAAEMGDIAVFDYSGSKDGVAFEGGTAEKHELKLGSGQFIPGFEEQLVGHNIGEEFDIEVTFPEDYHEDSLAGALTVFHIKLHELKVTELPELDDDFVVDVSEFNTVDELKEDTKAKLTKRKSDEAERLVEDELTEKVIALVEGDIPECMYENETDEIVSSYANRLKSQGIELDLWLKYTGQTMDDLRAQARVNAEKNVKLRLALEKIAQLENIVPTEEEINAEFERLAEMYKIPAEQVRSILGVDGASADLAVQKAMAFVKENAVVAEAAE